MDSNKVEGTFDKAKGSVKQAVGETFNDQSMANEGAADQVKGSAKQAWGSVKDSARNLTHSNTANETKTEAENDAHNTREDITDAAQKAKDNIQRGLGNLEHKANS